MAGLGDILKIIDRAPSALRFLVETNEAFNNGREVGGVKMGAASAGMSIVQGGWRNGLSAVSPRALEAAEIALPKAAESFSLFRQAMNGGILDDYEAIDDPDIDLKRHLKAMRSGAEAIFGARGEGKTTLAKALAYVHRMQTGYPVYCVNFDPKDVPEWAIRVGLPQITKDVRMIGEYLNPAALDDTDDDDEESDDDLGEQLAFVPKKKKAKKKQRRPVTEADIAAISRRIVIFDEAGMGFGQFAPGGKLTARATVINLMNYCRHIDCIVIFIGQMMKQLPKDLRSDTLMFYKRPDPEIEKQDGSGDDNAYCRQRWAEVKACFASIPHGQYGGLYVEPYNNLKSWAYVAAGKIGGHSYYGPFRFLPAPDRDEDEE